MRSFQYIHQECIQLQRENNYELKEEAVFSRNKTARERPWFCDTPVIWSRGSRWLFIVLFVLFAGLTLQLSTFTRARRKGSFSWDSLFYQENSALLSQRPPNRLPIIQNWVLWPLVARRLAQQREVAREGKLGMALECHCECLSAARLWGTGLGATVSEKNTVVEEWEGFYNVKGYFPLRSWLFYACPVLVFHY